MKTYHIESLGCAKNLVDSEVFAHILESAGYRPSDDAYMAQLVLVSGCAFLQSALAEFDQILCSFVEEKNRGNIKTIIVSGCVMNRVADEFKPLFPEVDAWIGLKDFDALRVFLSVKQSFSEQRLPLQDEVYAYLRISDGCENYCSYCTIPSIRGKLVSVPIEQLVSEARMLIARGAKEIILVAQDTCQYGLDIYGRRALPELIEAIHGLSGLYWLRLLYLHPDHFNLEWLEQFKKYPKLLPYFEIPIQHTEDRILKLMNRSKGRTELLKLFRTIKQELPQAVLRTTLIAGFPSETEEEHEAVLDFITQVPFLVLGCFTFSEEPGTPAAAMPEQIDEETAEARQTDIVNKHNSLLEDRLAEYVGKKLEVLIETEVGVDEESQLTEYLGRTWFQAPDIDGLVCVLSRNLNVGEIVTVEIEDVIESNLFATHYKDK